MLGDKLPRIFFQGGGVGGGGICLSHNISKADRPCKSLKRLIASDVSQCLYLTSDLA